MSDYTLAANMMHSLTERAVTAEARVSELEKQRDDAEAALLDLIRKEYGSVALWHLDLAMHGLWDDLVIRLHEKASRPWEDLTLATGGEGEG
jgi:hypothetical protein